MNCSNARDRLERYLDGELEMESNLEVVGHLEACQGCASVFEGERKFLDEIRRHGEGIAAPGPLRGRIERAIAGDAGPARPWPFVRAFVPAAAAAVLLALFVSIFSSGTAAASPDSIAKQAAAWHDRRPSSVVPLSSGPELASFFSSKGRKSCLHEKLVNASMNYGYRSACVENTGPAGDPTCWWTAACPKSGCRMTHACFKAPPGLDQVWPPGHGIRTVTVGNRTVIMGHGNGMVCLFVMDNRGEADRLVLAINSPRD